MKVICKKNSPGGYYSNITVDKEYELLDVLYKSPHSLDKSTRQLIKINNDKIIYYIIYDDDGKKGFFLEDYFYSTEELRDKSLNKILNETSI